MNHHAVRLMKEYIEKLAVGDTITTRELAQYVNSNYRCFGVTIGEVAHFLRQQELVRISPGVWSKVIRCR